MMGAMSEKASPLPARESTGKFTEFAEFAQYYDLVYANKDYAAEVDVFDGLVKRHLAGDLERGSTSVLDAGCGTGGHSLRLAELGYRVTGVDRSEEMLRLARHKSQPENNPVEWVHQDLQSLDLGRSFDVCGAFFAVLSFQITNLEISQALSNIRRHLNPSGLLLADVWYGPAVLTEKPEPRLKVMEASGQRILKYSTPELDALRHTNVVHQHVVVLDSENHKVAEIKESQTVRFWFPQELRACLEREGFEVLQLFAYPNVDRAPTTSDWELGFVARARP